MTLRRESRSPILGLGNSFGTSYLIPIIRENIKNGNIQIQEMVLQGSERLDTLAGRIWGDGRLYWILSISSDVGWSLQVPAGTVIRIPNLNDIQKYI